jgi:hypothetical protein
VFNIYVGGEVTVSTAHLERREVDRKREVGRKRAL